jgi:NADH:ubiquinone oxidoreductase subunit 2 (subunit N)
MVNLIIFTYKPEIFLMFSIILLLSYKFWFKNKCNNLHSCIFLIYSLVSLISTLILVFNTGFKTMHFTFFVLNLKIYFIKIIVLLISISCLILFRSSLIKSETDCLEYFIFYLFTTLMILITIMVNYFYLSFIALELLTLCFYILSSFNFNNFGFLVFRLFPYRKLFSISYLVLISGLVLIEFYNYSINLFTNNIVNDHLNWLNYKEYILICGIILILLSLFIKMIVFHNPTYFIYYQKTPLITIIYMHLIPKIIFFYVIVDFIYNNDYFKCHTYYINILFICLAVACLIISIGMRRLFLKHSLEYISLVNSGYLLLCCTPLTFSSLKFCTYFLFIYILTIFFYGSILVFFDNNNYPGKRLSFDTILSGIEKTDYCSIILSIFFFFYFRFTAYSERLSV